ncbi:TIGR02530 family flagellar biosynthesis protein [Paenibacillus xerothermodurans]|uniref:Flagellar biosynthesis protein n=1 Tax=Paenibacillus xerothermodurans TaxID=1977292 RepID=A0A2W1NCL1_PAEXE|nr:TIGR02530 family flagellar biosynthesis protein [Paenibacillus xerothermodurans]PZE22449.1 flagellar biosynthesis protein [Paenibacillus xerothermodurans]
MTERISIGQLYPGTLRPAPPTRNEQRPSSQHATFDNLLQNELVRFSNHAELRLRQRGIEFQPEQLAKIRNAIDNAASKGATESLMLIDHTALIVNIKNKTVITALDQASMKNNLFTQIDSAVIIS